jgi:hypothetical protein
VPPRVFRACLRGTPPVVEERCRRVLTARARTAARDDGEVGALAAWLAAANPLLTRLPASKLRFACRNAAQARTNKPPS